MTEFMTIEEMNRIRKERGYSIALLAEYTGVPAGTLTKIFSGVTKRPRTSTLLAIEKVLKDDGGHYAGKTSDYDFRSRKEQAPAVVKEGPEAGAYRTYEGGLHAYVDCDVPGPYRVSDMEELPEETRAELINGHLFYLESPTIIHQEIISAVFLAFANHIRSKKKSCKVLMAPMDVQILKDDMHLFQPDLMVVCDPEKVSMKRILGAPDFVLEVLSPATRRKDLIDKTMWYEKAGVRELWFIDPERKKLQIYDWTKEHKYQLVQLMPLEGKKDIAISQGELMIDLDEIRAIAEQFDS